MYRKCTAVVFPLQGIVLCEIFERNTKSVIIIMKNSDNCCEEKEDEEEEETKRTR